MKEVIGKILDEYKKSNPQQKEVIEILNRGFCSIKDNPKGEVLVVGINPSFVANKNDNGEDRPYSLATTDDKPYWKNTKRMLGDLLPSTAYLDLFPIKFSKQKEFELIFQQNALPLMAQLLSVTQQEIERLAPRLIIVQNRASRCYWGLGRNPKSVWMGYSFEKITDFAIEGKKIDVCRITGLKEDPKNERVCKMKKTNLVGTIVLFYGMYYRFAAKKNSSFILNAEEVKKLYEYSKSAKK